MEERHVCSSTTLKLRTCAAMGGSAAIAAREARARERCGPLLGARRLASARRSRSHGTLAHHAVAEEKRLRGSAGRHEGEGSARFWAVASPFAAERTLRRCCGSSASPSRPPRSRRSGRPRCARRSCRALTRSSSGCAAARRPPPRRHLAARHSNSPLPPVPPQPQSPLLALVAFGVYLFLWLAVGVATFRTVPEEAEALRRDIARARRGLAKLGVKA